MKMSPLISIITVVFNAVSTIEKTIESVIEQYYDVEFIIIDGASNDGTIEKVAAYKESGIFIISETDKGIYDAMNKGISIATGKWIYFLGADDYLTENCLHNVSGSFGAEYDIVFGNVMSDKGKIFKSTLNLKTILSNTIHHQGAFYNRSVFEGFRYDSTKKIMADYELNLKLYLKKAKYRKIDDIIAVCGTQGISSTDRLSLEETNMIRGKFYNKNLNYFFSLLLKIKYLLHYGLL